MAIAVLYPRHEYATTAEWYASWQTQSCLKRAHDVTAVVPYDPDDAAADVVAEVIECDVLVVIDPLIDAQPDIAVRLRSELERCDGPVVGVASSAGPQVLVYFCAAAALAGERRPLRHAINDRKLLIADSVRVSRWQGERTTDLAPFVPSDAQSILHVGCGDGMLGAVIKRRQQCRFVGLETSRDLAADAKRRIDDVYTGEIVDTVPILEEEFDCIITSGILEQTADPWSLLEDLRRISMPGGSLVATIPNVSHIEVIGALLRGRFEVARQLRHFTRQSVLELMEIAGWTIDTIQGVGDATPDDGGLITVLRQAGVTVQDDFFATEFVALARNRNR